jgi:hypothetical protein
MYCPGIFRKVLRKATENLSQSSRYPVQDLNPWPPENRAAFSVCLVLSRHAIATKICNSFTMSSPTPTEWGRNGAQLLKHNAMKRWKWVVIFTPRRFTSRERIPGSHWIRGWVDPRAGLDVAEKRQSLIWCKMCIYSSRQDMKPIFRRTYLRRVCVSIFQYPTDI